MKQYVLNRKMRFSIFPYQVVANNHHLCYMALNRMILAQQIGCFAPGCKFNIASTDVQLTHQNIYFIFLTDKTN